MRFLLFRCSGVQNRSRGLKRVQPCKFGNLCTLMGQVALINPLASGAPSLASLGCHKVLIFVAGKDDLRDRGIWYCDAVKESGWEGGGTASSGGRGTLLSDLPSSN